ncbi:MAG: PAS domain S-box protein [Deltaproteobacteria bacterium]|nr:PAS domain S-box protein [Deltaproteobacteria bacterium]
MGQESQEKNEATRTRWAAEELRRRALALLERHPGGTAAPPPPDLDELLHELRVHRVELELQNEELRAAQRETEALRARYFHLFELAPVGYLTLDARGGIAEGNLAAVRFLGLPRLKLAGRLLGFFVAAADRPTFNRFLGEVFATGTRQTCEVTLQPENAAEARLLLEGVREQPRTGVTPCCRVALIDISARVAVEASLRESEERFRLFFANAGFGKALTSPDGRLSRVNRALCDLLGYERAQLEALHLVALAHPDQREECRAWLRAVLAGEETAPRREMRLLRRDGEAVWADVCMVLERAPDGAPLCLLIEFADLTEKKQLQANLSEADHLASVGLLAAGVAHEINNPLAYVLYNLETAAEDLPRMVAAERGARDALEALLSDDARKALRATSGGARGVPSWEDVVERVRQASEGAGRVRKIARSLSSFSRVERRDVQPLDLRIPLDAAVDMAAAELKYRARLVRDLAPVPHVLGSEQKLAQVFLNLLVNAAQALPEGEAERHEVRVRTWQEGDEVCTEIRDTGPGISEAVRARIFEPFFTTKPPGRGTGLGLSISRSIVQALGGRLDARNHPDGGAAFTVRLRAADEAREAALSTDAAEEAMGETTGPAPAPSEGRLLIVDDEPLVRGVLRRILETYTVVEAASGAEAQNILATDRGFDLILCDVTMPTMSGIDLYRWLAALDGEAARRIVLVTGGAFTPRAEAFLAETTNPRLNKPFDPQNVREMVARLVAAGRQKPA